MAPAVLPSSVVGVCFCQFGMSRNHLFQFGSRLLRLTFGPRTLPVEQR